MMLAYPGRNNADGEAIPLMSLHISAENLYYAGWIATFEGGAKRFNVAPQFQVNFEVVNDRHSTSDKIIPSYAKRSRFTGAFLSGAVAQTDQAIAQASLTTSGQHTVDTIRDSDSDTADLQIQRVLRNS
jgi:hypothetical protein